VLPVPSCGESSLREQSSRFSWVVDGVLSPRICVCFWSTGELCSEGYRGGQEVDAAIPLRGLKLTEAVSPQMTDATFALEAAVETAHQALWSYRWKGNPKWVLTAHLRISTHVLGPSAWYLPRCVTNKMLFS
jgi:hypothetical protein